METKEIVVAIYGRRFLQPDWRMEIERSALEQLIARMRDEFAPFGIAIAASWEEEILLDVRGYADLLNCVRLRSVADGLGNICLGHVIGQSLNCDLFEDIRRGVSRLAFAPEMIAPDGENRRVCHNCGCGC